MCVCVCVCVGVKVPWPGGVENDFLEVPSMMFEHWPWQPEVLNLLSSKYDAPEERLPESDIAAMQALRGHNRALKSMRYYAMAKFDLEMHVSNKSKLLSLDAIEKKSALNILLKGNLLLSTYVQPFFLLCLVALHDSTVFFLANFVFKIQREVRLAVKQTVAVTKSFKPATTQQCLR